MPELTITNRFLVCRKTRGKRAAPPARSETSGFVGEMIFTTGC